MAERTVVVGSRVGLHARPAALLARAAAEQPVAVTIRKSAGGDPVAANSVLNLMALGAQHGEEVVLAADGDGADTALDALVQVISADLDH